ncbi:glycerate kinase [Actinoplanes sp. LDG1-06]|uniref:Glycerate kinase n=1 Tax=Paractinoplanes ovalisporus TaxID=2810368 RepID=A0ABS2AKY7_9ACTN|nr:glycerate kinase [Actinoplanes ovalisporus]MBM2620461.1 glycerate kinase [Actinoplanes ovalisporus]
MRVLVAPDKFKGSLSAVQVAAAAGQGLATAGVQASLLPLADGGDGSVAAALHAGFTAHDVAVRGADGRTVKAQFASDGRTAVVEVASTCGLATLDAGTFAPTTASSHGFGQAVAAAAATGVRRIVLALGGSASTDGGSGMLAALGARFHDVAGAEVEPCGDTLADIASADFAAIAMPRDVELIVATDVANPLLGPDGAAAVFGPQKGANTDQVRLLEAGLKSFASTVAGPAAGSEPGAGAAGGIGFAAMLLGARPVSGAEFFLDLLGFDTELERCQAVLVGEGSMDAQTLWGKLPAVIAARAAPRPVYAIVGHSTLSGSEQSQLGIGHLCTLTGMTTGDPSRDPDLSFTLVRRAAAAIGQRLRHPAET